MIGFKQQHERKQAQTVTLHHDEAQVCNSQIANLRQQHARTRNDLLFELIQMPFEELLNAFLTEMDAKNEAYYFIMEKGLTMDFVNRT